MQHLQLGFELPAACNVHTHTHGHFDEFMLYVSLLTRSYKVLLT